jgi:hypothetical protein
MNSISPFRLFGILTLLAGLIVSLSLVGNQERVAVGGHDLASAAPVSISLIIIGVGLILHRKWAAVLLTVGSLTLAIWMIVGSILLVPLPWSLINIGIGSVLCLPAVITVRSWGDLSKSWL